MRYIPYGSCRRSGRGIIAYFAMNGQTGKFVGNLPTDKNAFARWFLGTTGVMGVRLIYPVSDLGFVGRWMP